MNAGTNCLRVYKHLLTNRLHGKAVELCLAKAKQSLKMFQVLLPGKFLLSDNSQTDRQTNNHKETL